MSELLEEIEQEERFSVNDDQQADWCLRKITEADAELERLTEWYECQKERAKERHDSRVSYFTGLLQEYFKKVPAHETKTMSKYTLPSGDLVMSKSKEDYKPVDEETILNWCYQNDPDLIKVKTTPNWAELKKRLVTVDGNIIDKETGIRVEGVELFTKESEFKAKVRA